MMYAIVDIETTGGYAAANGITEISILLHDGQKVVDQYETLVNPGVSIPVYIQALTGITDSMVSSAPSFGDIAEEVYQLIRDKIFVAHNVNFDYSFLRHHLLAAGFDLQCKKLCTVRLGRKIFPGLVSYSLGKLCTQLNIEIENRHRAAGDAQATARLFSLLLENDRDGHIGQFLNRKSKEQQLPPNLQRSEVDALPSSPGVYYFKDQKGSVVYVGKAVNLKKRVLSHFSGNSSSRQRQEFLRNIYSVSYTRCGTELIAFILEAIEIKRLWPVYNRSMKRFEQSYGLFLYEDGNGFLRLMLDKRRKFSSPLFSFNNMLEGRNMLLSLIRKFELCPKLCFIERNAEGCNAHYCKGVCRGGEPFSEYNKRVLAATEELKGSLPSFMLLDKGRDEAEQSVILMENGSMYGIGYVPASHTISDPDFVKPLLDRCPSNDYIRNLILDYAHRHPELVI